MNQYICIATGIFILLSVNNDQEKLYIDTYYLSLLSLIELLAVHDFSFELFFIDLFIYVIPFLLLQDRYDVISYGILIGAIIKCLYFEINSLSFVIPFLIISFIAATFETKRIIMSTISFVLISLLFKGNERHMFVCFAFIGYFIYYLLIRKQDTLFDFLDCEDET